MTPAELALIVLSWAPVPDWHGYPIHRPKGFADVVAQVVLEQEDVDPVLMASDLKHSRITSWIGDGKDLAGVSQLTGVDVDTLAEHYIHPDVEAAKRVLRRAG